MAKTVKTVAIGLQKGGTGKSTLAINVAAELAAADQDTLLIDLDPHGAATEGVGLADEYERQPPTLHRVLSDASADLSDVVVSTDWMDVVPSNIELTLTEDALAGENRRVERLSNALEGVRDTYDWCIIDCPPNLGNLTDNALYAAPGVLVPALPESPSIRAIELLFDQMRLISERFERPTEPIGIVANRVESTQQAERMLEKFREYDLPVWEIRKRVALQYAYEAGEPLREYEPSSDMNDVFEQIAADLMAKREVSV